MVMLATLLPCLLSTMHEYTPLSVRFNPLLNVKACADERSSLVSKRFQWYFGAKLSKEWDGKIQAHESGNVIKFMQKINQLWNAIKLPGWADAVHKIRAGVLPSTTCTSCCDTVTFWGGSVNKRAREKMKKYGRVIVKK